MNGLELSERYWREVGLPAFAAGCPGILERAAVGLAGEGSDCFGFDDGLSRDHDWGPGFCVWLTAEDEARFGARAREVYRSLPGEYLGYTRLRVSEQTADRVGVWGIADFFARYIGLSHAPQTMEQWRSVPEVGLFLVTNGRVFQDGAGELTRIRQELLRYYPEELRKKKLAANCALAAQAGQYNYARCMRRGETVPAMQALGLFVTHIQQVVFLLNRRYAPYYKWTHRALCELPTLGDEVGQQLRSLSTAWFRQEETIEAISAAVIRELRTQNLSGSESDFLLDHAQEIQQSIQDPLLQKLHLMAE